MKTDKHLVEQLFASCRGLIVDEAHVLPAESFWRVAMSTTHCYYRVGLSGTPLARGDRRSVLAVGALGPVIYRVRPEVLIDAGVLARPTIHLVEVREHSLAPNWQRAYAENIVGSPTRNGLVVEAAKRAPKPCLVFVKEIKHGKLLLKQLERAGVPCAFVWGSHGTDARNRSVRDLLSGRIEVLICSVIFQEGTDIPDLRSVVIASGGKSVIAALQRIGRGMRVAAGKTTFDVYDIADLGCGCTRTKGLGTRPHAGCRWLERHTRERVKAYAAEGNATHVVQWVAGAQE
jgi:superfamily II DNA or RNA helicase